nr:MAG TPA: hypothetical protein [Caudoviricetes sp.]
MLVQMLFSTPLSILKQISFLENPSQWKSTERD